MNSLFHEIVVEVALGLLSFGGIPSPLCRGLLWVNVVYFSVNFHQLQHLSVQFCDCFLKVAFVVCYDVILS